MASPTSPDENPGHKTKRKGVRRPRWRNGYVEEWCPVRMRYVYQHRLVVERRIGRFLLSTEIVHHENGIKTDNRDENLVRYDSRSGHVAEHVSEGTWGGKGRPRPGTQRPRIPCPVCTRPFKPKRRTTPAGLQVDTKTCSPSCGQTLRHR